ncbi:MAG: 23S rRNA (adenine(2503)-C(2))-methyltransferase RlmN [Clostridia bacterium]|nr:23S rRNA (adenine(2503)-C(2))-methyltransferase RlmN [Clostridia bacterium]
MRDARGLSVQEWEELMAAIGEPRYRGRQVFAWIHGRGVEEPGAMTDLPLSLRARLPELVQLGPLPLAARQQDPVDGTVKYLFRLRDGQGVEAVLLRHRYGDSLCVSTQVGCLMGCRFCASTIGGLVRNLEAGEMIGQVLAARRDLQAREPTARIGRLDLMGIGEPLENYDEVLRFIRLAHEPLGLDIGYRHITLSTSGIVPRIHQLAREGLPITLAVSLHAPNDELRTRLMPVNRRYPIAALMEACRAYVAATGRRVTFEYVLIRGVNDSPELARELARLVRPLLCHVNLIPLNPSGRGLEPSSPEAVRTFLNVLRRFGVSATVRRELGQAIDAACGQLRRRLTAVAGGT